MRVLWVALGILALIGAVVVLRWIERWTRESAAERLAGRKDDSQKRLKK